MLGIGFPELVVILLIALLLFGAGRLPTIARSLGQAVNEFKKGLREGGDDQSSVKDEEKK